MAKNSKVLQPTTSHNQAKKAIEDIYQKKTQLEHILLRPDTYIGALLQNADLCSCTYSQQLASCSSRIGSSRRVGYQPDHALLMNARRRSDLLH